MAKKDKRFEDWGDPYKALAMAVVRQAAIDLKPSRVKADPLRALDASLFLVECGPEFCEAIDVDFAPANWEKVLHGKI